MTQTRSSHVQMCAASRSLASCQTLGSLASQCAHDSDAQLACPEVRRQPLDGVLPGVGLAGVPVEADFAQQQPQLRLAVRRNQPPDLQHIRVERLCRWQEHQHECTRMSKQQPQLRPAVRRRQPPHLQHCV